jgi:hypothetical protein
MLQARDGIIAVMTGLALGNATLPPLGLCSTSSSATNLSQGSPLLEHCLAQLHLEICGRHGDNLASEVVQALRSDECLVAASVRS